MSGHSKWATTKRAKAVTDAKRANVFTRLSKNVTLAAKDGGDPTMNFKLRLAIDKAKEANMPKDNIERAIKRGTGEESGATLEEILYEGYGPHGSAFLIQSITDNKNRAVSEIKHIFTLNNGNLGAQNSVAWMFDKVGGIKTVPPAIMFKEKPGGAGSGSAGDEAELAAIDAGAEDLEWLDEETIWLYTKPNEINQVKENLKKLSWQILDDEIGYKAKEVLPVDENIRPSLEKIYNDLDEAEDVQNFWSNMAV